MNVTITIPVPIVRDAEDVAAAEAAGLRLVYGAGTLFIEGDLAAAAAFAQRFDEPEQCAKRWDGKPCILAVEHDGRHSLADGFRWDYA